MQTMKTIFRSESMEVMISAVTNQQKIAVFDLVAFNWKPIGMDTVVKTVTYFVQEDGKVVRTFSSDIPKMHLKVHDILCAKGIMFEKKSFSFKNFILSLGQKPYRIEKFFSKKFLESLK